MTDKNMSLTDARIPFHVMITKQPLFFCILHSEFKAKYMITKLCFKIKPI